MSHKKFKNLVLARFSIFSVHLFLPIMMLLYSTREIEFILLFFIIIKDIIFLLNYYEKSEQNIVCKGVIGVINLLFTLVLAKKGVILKTSGLQCEKYIHLKVNQHFINTNLSNKKVSCKVS